MARSTKLTKELQQQVGESLALGLTYSLAAASAGISYQTFNDWMQKGKNSKSGKYFEFARHIKRFNAEAALKCLKRLKEAADAGNCTVCIWILERRFSDDFGRRVYRRTDVVSENQNVNVDIAIDDSDGIRTQILEKFSLGEKNLELSII